MRRLMVLAAILSMPLTLWASEAPSQFGIDAPALAKPGPFAVGVKTLHLREAAQADVLAFDSAKGTAPMRDRDLEVELWYPAKPAPGAPKVHYHAEFPSEPPAPPAAFTVAGIAVRDALAAGQNFPLIIVSHGYSNDPAAMTWLTENLASKGYVVAAIHHNDPPITDRSKFIGPLLRRPLDIAYVAQTLQRTLASQHLIDAERTALVGYSIGGYGVLTAAGAVLDAKGPPTQMIPGGLLLPYVQGGALASTIVVAGLRAVIAISPAGGGSLAAWGAQGLGSIKVPLLLIAGDKDRTVNYPTGARSFFEQATAARRYLLTFKGAGHAIGLNPAPDAMRSRLWDQDWFEDPVWRAERVNAINAHFITAFLDRFVKGDESRAAYLDVPVPDSADGVWPVPAAPDVPAPYNAYSSGAAGISVWKGFQRSQNAGLELLQAQPADPAASP